MRIEHIRLKNFRVFRDVELGDLSPMSVFVGPNGAGKSTLFDVFGFLHDSLVHNVRQALSKRGGFNEVRSRGASGPIEIELKFREPGEPLVTYLVQIDLYDGKAGVAREILRYKRGSYGAPWHFLDFSWGKGRAITNESALKAGEDITNAQREEEQEVDPDTLALKGLGQFERFRKASTFRKLIESWHVSDFHISEARPSQEAGFAEHVSRRGDNLPLVAQYMYEHHRDLFGRILDRMRERVPGVTNVEATETADGRIVLRFQDGEFKDPFVARYVSDGTIKMFAYLLLLYDPEPHPLLCVEEPENQLYPNLLQELAEEFREYARRGGQVFVSTHSPDFLNGVRLDEIFWLEKREGHTRAFRASEYELLQNLVREGDLPGWLWKQGLLSEAGVA